MIYFHLTALYPFEKIRLYPFGVEVRSRLIVPPAKNDLDGTLVMY